MANSKRSPSERVATDEQIAQAAEILWSGGVIALPTDTVYGIGASIEHPEAVERLFSLKRRAGTKAIPILVDSPEQLRRLAAHLPQAAQQLAGRFWPGALTIVVEASDEVPEVILRGGTTVGLRMPASADALALIRAAGGALAVTSANLSGDIEARSAAEARAVFRDGVDYILDGGPAPLLQPSTVVDVTRDPPRVLRAGALSPWEITAVLEGHD
jgi:L-threonylcarbamoyladenylate synthase